MTPQPCARRCGVVLHDLYEHLDSLARMRPGDFTQIAYTARPAACVATLTLLKFHHDQHSFLGKFFAALRKELVPCTGAGTLTTGGGFEIGKGWHWGGSAVGQIWDSQPPKVTTLDDKVGQLTP